MIVQLGDSAAWKLGDVATWVAAIANVAVVITAFMVQRAAFKHEHKNRDHERADLHVAALNSAKATLEIFDNVIGFKNVALTDRKRSDVLGRLNMCSEFTRYYLSTGIIDNEIVALLITIKSLIDRTVLDVQSVSYRGDELPHGDLVQIYSHRTLLRQGVEEMLDKAFQRPVQTTPI